MRGAQARAERAERRAELDQVLHRPADVEVGQLEQRPGRAGERDRALGVGAESDGLHGDAGDVEDGQHDDRGADRPGDGLPRVLGLLAQRSRALEPGEGEEAEDRAEDEGVQVDPGRQAEDAAGDHAGVHPVAVADLDQDDHHEHEDEGDRDRLDVEQGAGRALDHPGAERPDDHGDRQGQDDPVGPLPPAQVLQHAGQEVARRGGRGRHEHEVHQAHGPAREHPGAGAERGADEAVDRPGVVVLPGQQHVAVADQAAGHAGEHERQRGPAADQRGHPRTRERHGQRRGHRADGQADRLPHVQVALQPVLADLAG